MISWESFDVFNGMTDRFMPTSGEGNTMASQAVTAVNKLVYKWFNDGDVYDNTSYMVGWCNDISDAANWLAANVPGCAHILNQIWECYDDDEYAEILFETCEEVESRLPALVDEPKTGSIYDCPGDFRFVEQGCEDDEW